MIAVSIVRLELMQTFNHICSKLYCKSLVVCNNMEHQRTVSLSWLDCRNIEHKSTAAFLQVLILFIFICSYL